MSAALALNSDGVKSNQHRLPCLWKTIFLWTYAPHLISYIRGEHHNFHINRKNEEERDQELVTYADKPWLKHYHKGVPQKADLPEISLPEMLDQATSKWSNNTAIYFMGKKLTYDELEDHIDRLATALEDIGIKRGDVVAVHLPNIPQFIISYYGAMKAGATVTCVSALLTPPEVKFQLNDAGAKAIVTMDGQPFQAVESIRKETKLKYVIVTSLVDYLPGKPRRPTEKPGAYQFLNLIMDHQPNSPKVKINPKEDIAVLQYTGGTTGTPKGAMLTHYGLVSNAIQMLTWFSWDQTEGKEVCLLNLPLFHIYGMTCCMNGPISQGYTIAMNVDPRDLVSLLSLIRSTKPTFFPGVPVLYMRLLQVKGVEKYYEDLKTIRMCNSGAAPMPPEVIRQFEGVTGASILEGYGLTECCPVTHINPDKETRKIGSIGLPLPNTDCRIVDIETGTKVLPVGEVGELAIKGPQTMKGYWKKPEETTKQIKKEIGGATGPWVLTGDMAKMDEQGYFYIVDRKKDMIDVSGFKVYPREVDDILFEHPSVAMAAAVGIPDPKNPGNERVKAYIVVKPGIPENEETKKSIIQFCRTKLAPYKIPKEIEFKKELPTSVAGKVLKRTLKDEEKKKA
jgi:long-chain acyl-CoA synthetase